MMVLSKLHYGGVFSAPEEVGLRTQKVFDQLFDRFTELLDTRCEVQTLAGVGAIALSPFDPSVMHVHFAHS